MLFGHGLLAWWTTTWHHRHRLRLETLWSTLVLLIWLLSAARHRHHLLWGASHRHLIESSLRWALVIVLPLLLHILWCLWWLIRVSLVIASTTHVVIVVILVLPILVVHILTAMTLPWLLWLILLHHGVIGPVLATHLWSRIHHVLLWWHWHLVVGPEATLVHVHWGILLWCSRGFELLRRARNLEVRLEFCYSRVEVSSNIGYYRIATKTRKSNSILASSEMNLINDIMTDQLEVNFILLFQNWSANEVLLYLLL